MGVIREEVLEEIRREQYRQAVRWGGLAHDVQHGHRDWTAFIVRMLGQAEVAAEGDHPADYRRRMVQVAALAISAVESTEAARLLSAQDEALGGDNQ